jgi:hypothetical protein
MYKEHSANKRNVLQMENRARVNNSIEKRKKGTSHWCRSGSSGGVPG